MRALPFIQKAAQSAKVPKTAFIDALQRVTPSRPNYWLWGSLLMSQLDAPFENTLALEKAIRTNDGAVRQGGFGDSDKRMPVCPRGPQTELLHNRRAPRVNPTSTSGPLFAKRGPPFWKCGVPAKMPAHRNPYSPPTSNHEPKMDHKTETTTLRLTSQIIRCIGSHNENLLTNECNDQSRNHRNWVRQ
jgi:hypothetical protein